MKKLLALFALLVCVSPAWGQQDIYESPLTALSSGFTGGSGTVNVLAAWQSGGTSIGNSSPTITCNGTNCTLASGDLRVPDGTVLDPSITGVTTTTGVQFGSTYVGFTVGGASEYIFSDTVLAMGAGQQITWSASSASAGPDLIITRDAAAVLQLGMDTNTPATQTLEAGDAATGNNNGSNLVLRGGLKAGSGQDGVAVIGRGYTVAALPTGTVVAGARAWVTDAVACTFVTTLTGGGSAFCPVIYDGAGWIGG